MAKGPGVVAAVIAAAVVLSPLHAHAQPARPAPAPGARQMLAGARERAIQQIVASARSDDPFLRANAIEAAQSLPDRIVPMAQLALGDEHPAVRFAALATIGRLKLNDLGPAARPLLDDPSLSVRAAAMFALRRTGQRVDISPMARMLAGDDPGLRGNVALLMGMMEDPSAIPMLKDTVRVPMRRVTPERAAIVRLQVAEAIVRLGDDEALDPLRAAVYSQFDEARVLAIQTLGRLGDRALERAMADVLEETQPRAPIEVRLAAAEALTRLGRPGGLPTLLEGAASQLPTARAQSAIALGLVNHEEAAAALLKLLEDPHEQVRLAAAAGILRATSPATPGRGGTR